LIEATPVPQRTFSVVAHVIDYVNPTTGARTATNVTAGDIAAMLTHVNTIWSQVGIDFTLGQTVVNATNDPQERDVVLGYGLYRASTNDNVAANSVNAINIYFVNSIQVEDGPLTGYAISYDNGNTVLPRSEPKPGVLVAKTNGPAAANVRDVPAMARTLAHELGHYFLNNGNHDSRIWNLMIAGGGRTNRDLDLTQAEDIRDSVVTPTNHDGQ
jgi:hypothetical protein